MQNENINFDKVLEGIKQLKSEKKEYLDKFLENAPIWLLNSIQFVTMEKNSVFIKENEEVDRVYILLDGIVKGIDYRMFGIAYNYMRFSPIEVFGSMEMVLEVPTFKTTLVTVTDCKMLVIPIYKYEKWMRNDINAFFMDVKSMVNYLLEQARKERIFLFLQGTDRLFMLFMQMYEESVKNDVCKISLTRQELSDCSGLCVKTINRAVKKLEKEDYIKKEGHKLIITQEQYLKIKNYIVQKIGQ